MKIISLSMLAFALLLSGCISGAPRLLPEQELRLEKITVHQDGEPLSIQDYKVVEELSAADCSGAPGGGRIWGNAERAIDTLKRKAAAVNADAVVNVSCHAIPFLNNCFAAQRCSGEAVQFQ